jgi:hypothetical protein
MRYQNNPTSFAILLDFCVLCAHFFFLEVFQCFERCWNDDTSTSLDSEHHEII